MFKKTSLILMVTLVFFLFQAVMPTAADQPDKKTVKKLEKLMKKGDKAANKGDFPKAFEHYNKAVELNADYAPLHFGMGRVYNMQKKFDDSIVSLQKALEIQPEYPEAKELLTKTLMGIGSEMARQRQPEKSNSYFLKVLDIPNITPQQKLTALFQIGNNYAALQNQVKSNEYFVKVLETPDLLTVDKAKFVGASYRLGINYYQLQKFKEVDKYFSKLIQVEGLKTEYLKVYTFGLYLLGVSNSQLMNAEKSTKYLMEYLELTVNNPSDPYAPLANFLVGSNKYNSLQKEIEPIKDSKDKNAVEKVAELAKSKKDVLTYLTKAVELNPKLEPAYTLIGNYHFLCLDYEKALQVYSSLVEKFPGSSDVGVYKGFIEKIKKAKAAKK